VRVVGGGHVCEGIRSPAAVERDASRVTLSIFAEIVNGLARVVANGQAVWIMPTVLQALLYLVAGRLRGGEGGVTRVELGHQTDAFVKAISRLRAALGLPDAQRIDEHQKERGYRLASHVVVEHVAAVELAR
jgi:hypothetical protein